MLNVLDTVFLLDLQLNSILFYIFELQKSHLSYSNKISLNILYTNDIFII